MPPPPPGSARWPVSAGTRRRASGGAARCRRPRCRRRPSARTHLGQRGDPVGHRRADPARLARRPRARRRCAIRAHDGRAPRTSSALASTTTSSRSPPTCGLQLVGGALGDDAAGVDDHDLVGELVGLVEVLRGQQHGGAAGDERADRRPHLVAVAGVEAGGRLVEEEHRRGEDQGDGQVEPAPHAARVVLDRLVGRRRPGRTARAARRPGAGPPALVSRLSRPNSTRFWRPLRISSTAGFCPLSPMRRRTSSASARHVDAGDRGRAAVGAQQRGEDAHRRGLAGAVRAEQPAHRAARHRRSNPSSAAGRRTLHQAVGPMIADAFDGHAVSARRSPLLVPELVRCTE